MHHDRHCSTKCCASSPKLDLWRCKVFALALARQRTQLGLTQRVLCAEARPQWDGRQLEDLRRTAHSMKGSAGYLKADALIDSSITLMAAAEVCTAAHEHISSTFHTSCRPPHACRLTSVCAQAGIAGDERDIPDALVRPEATFYRVLAIGYWLLAVFCRVTEPADFLLAPDAYRPRGKATLRISLRT